VHHGESFLEDEGAGTSSSTIQVVDNPMRLYMCTRQLKFTWDPQHEAEARKHWKEKTYVRVKDLVNKALNENPNKIISYMTEDLRAHLRHKRENDEVFKKRSARNKKNKVEGSKGKIGHSQRSISSTMWLYKLVTTVTLMKLFC